MAPSTLLVAAFQPSTGRTVTISSPLSPSGGRPAYQDMVVPANDNNPQSPSASSSTSLNMFMGSDGGFLGIGAPELVRFSG